jgi:hypothetical protein
VLVEFASVAVELTVASGAVPLLADSVALAASAAVGSALASVALAVAFSPSTAAVALVVAAGSTDGNSTVTSAFARCTSPLESRLKLRWT